MSPLNIVNIIFGILISYTDVDASYELRIKQHEHEIARLNGMTNKEVGLELEEKHGNKY